MGYIIKGFQAKNAASKIIADEVLLYGSTTEQLIEYFRRVMYVLKHYHATNKLNKC